MGSLDLERDAEQVQRDISCGFFVNKAEVRAIAEVEQIRLLDRLVRGTMNMDSTERLIDDKKGCSQEDIRFLVSVSKFISHIDDHYCIGLPLKADNVGLPEEITSLWQQNVLT